MAFVKSAASNHKLDIFLKRNLPSSEYQKIRCYEQCVVDKTVKLALLTNTSLLISDTPPRTIQYILPLKSIANVNLVQELPDFLKGPDRETAQHIAIHLHEDQVSQYNAKLALSRSSSTDSARSGKSSPLLWSYIPQILEQTTSVAATLAIPDNDSLVRSKSQLDVNNNFLSASLNDSGYSGSSNSLAAHSSKSLSSSFSSLSQSLSDPARDSPSRPPLNKQNTLDLYLLTDDPTFFKLIRTSLLYGKIHETMQLDFSRERKHRKVKKKDSAREQQLFNQLSEEIQQCYKLENSFSLVGELTTAVNNNTAIKGHFWKDPSLLIHMVTELSKYSVHNNNNRADEIEYLVLLTSCLCIMMRESDHLTSRALLLTANGNTVFRDLLAAVCIDIETKKGVSDSVEIEGLRDELLDTKAGLMNELKMFAADQAKWGCNISMTYFISTLESLSYFRLMIDKLVNRAFTMLSQDRACSVQQTLLLFHYFSVLEAVLKYSPYYSQIIKTKYREEIRYYCNNPSSKILRISPIQCLTINKIQSVIDEVTKH